MDSLIRKLLWQTTIRRAALNEEFLQHHLHHIPAPALVMSTTDLVTETISCGCGASFVTTIVVNIETRHEAGKSIYGPITGGVRAHGVNRN